MAQKTVLITGAGSGIGRDSAKQLVANGHKVIATTHREESVAELQEYLGSIAQVFKLDVTNADDRAKIADLDLDVLVNNAAQGDTGSLADVDIDRLRELFEVNLFSSLALSQIAIKKMANRGGGTVVFVSSITGRIPAPFFMPYAMTKFAVSAAAAGLRGEMKVLDKGIHVSVVEHGPYATGFNQKMLNSGIGQMGEDSIFSAQQAAAIKAKAEKDLKMEAKTTKSIVAKIVKASEADKPKLRYVAPGLIAFVVRMARIFGV